MTAKSEYFRACLGSGFTEANSNIVTLPEDAVVAVRVFVDWLYNGRVEITEAVRDEMVAVYRFADKPCSEAFCNDFVDAVRAYASNNRMYFILAPQKLYEQGLGQTPFAKFCLKAMVWFCMALSHDRIGEQVRHNILREWISHPELLQDFALEACNFHWMRYSDPAGWTGCNFHTHTSGSCCDAGDTES